MAGSEFLDAYDGQSTDELIALSATHRIDSIVLAFEQALQDKASLNKEERTIVAIEGLEREVNNGGFSQFFVNSSNEFVPCIQEALKAIGCPKTATLCSQAMAILGITEDMSTDTIEDLACDASDEQDQRLSKLDEIYYEGEEEPIAGKLFEFIQQNRSVISTTSP